MIELATLGPVIKTAYESQENTNAFTDAEKTKLENLSEQTGEGPSEIDLSTKGAEIKTIYENQFDTNAFTDAEKTKLASLENSTPLTGDDIKTLYEAENNTNAFTDLDKQRVSELFSRSTFSGSFTDLTNIPNFLMENRLNSPNGAASLDGSGKVPLSQLNISGLQFKGAWNPNTNTPSLLNGTGTVGDFYKASAAGTFNFGIVDYTFVEGDWVIFAAGVWQRLGSSDAVSMVNGKVGDVTLTAADVGALPSTYVPPSAPVSSVNGKTGVVALSAADVGALPTSYTPPNQVKNWPDITNKPDFAALYQPKQRGSIGPAIPALLLRLTSNKAAANATSVTIPWDAAVYNPFGIWTSGTDIVIPSWAKYFRASCNLQWGGAASSTSGIITARIYLNGTSAPGTSLNRIFGNINVLYQYLATGVVPVSTGNIITVSVNQSTASTRNIEANAVTWLQIELFEGN